MFWTGSEDTVLPIPAYREKRSGERMREPIVLLLGLTLAGNGDGLEKKLDYFCTIVEFGICAPSLSLSRILVDVCSFGTMSLLLHH